MSHVTIKYGWHMPTMKGKRVLTSLYLDPPMHAALKQLSEITRVPIGGLSPRGRFRSADEISR